ncbi:MAG: neutral zinc metallopeptidase [Bacteroidota bacterium]|nr:neutral zinc metallopeptidase [Bacteroidota bacterium]
MKWKGRERSGNVEDRRKGGATKVAAGGGIIALVFFAIQFFSSGGSTEQLIQQAPQLIEMVKGSGGTSEANNSELTQAEKDQLEFVEVVLRDTEVVWEKMFNQMGLTYRKPQFVLFRGSVQSACGGASTASGPFYCSADEKVYMDLDFFDQLSRQFKTNIGEFAIAYVIAHEVGHHVQHLLGTLKEVRLAQQKVNQTEANQIMVALELQADFYAGLWAHHNKKYLEEGDIEDALNAASTVGDDNIQKKTQGYVVEESFTHGTSKQRMEWFNRGYQTGDFKQGDTFKVLLK